MFVIAIKDHKDCAEILCDKCGKRVGPEDTAMWRTPIKNDEGHRGNVLFLHDKACCPPFENGLEDWWDMSVKEYLIGLCDEMGLVITWKRE